MDLISREFSHLVIQPLIIFQKIGKKFVLELRGFLLARLVWMMLVADKQRFVEEDVITLILLRKWMKPVLKEC